MNTNLWNYIENWVKTHKVYKNCSEAGQNSIIKYYFELNAPESRKLNVR